MSFDLKNAGSTYMRAMMTLFHDMIHKEIKVYVDYIIIKSRKSLEHLDDLRKFFECLRRYDLNLNPAKCSFGVPAGKVLGFIKAIKGQALADHLAENPVDGDYEPLIIYFPDEEVLFAGEDIAESYPGWRMFFDGAANFKGVRVGAVLISESGQHYPVLAKIIFPCTNNMAEYEACILGIRMAVDMNIKYFLVIGDSDLLIHQVQGEWSTKNVKILSYLHCIKELCMKFTKIEFKHVPRIQNEFVDALTTLSFMIQHPDKNYIDPIEIEIKDQHAYYFHVNEEPDGKPWYHDIKKFLATLEYPKNATNGQK
ncbi:uncharacterized protein LOC142178247 [Nicotiana tabacum]|uniref:Uncharacterized protein LOC142178247 n=1 Tax=Nicotiana tabacum TaxID=4097 RepID=A0AC58U2J2_TOBAC